MKIKIVLTIIFLLFANCMFAQTNSNNIFFGDIHNSSITSMFINKNVAGLSNNKNGLSFDNLRKINVKFLVLSIGIARFSMRHQDTIKIEHVVDFFRKFKKYNKERYHDSICFKSDNCNADLHIEFALEGSHLLKGNLQWIDTLHSIGVRTLSIAHWFHNEFIIAHQKDTNSYRYAAPSRLNNESVLSEKGKLLVEKMINLRMIIDVSHLPTKAFWQVVAINNNRSPIIASHSNSYTVCENSRNLTDKQIQAIKDANGIIGICFHSPMLSNKNNSNILDIVTHINYIGNKFGFKILVFGTDFDGRIKLPDNIKYFGDITKIFTIMKNSGMSSLQLNMILYDNIRAIYYKK